MGKYRKKPVVIEAVQWKGMGFQQWHEMRDFVGSALFPYETNPPDNIVIRTLEGDMRAVPGDWIIKGVKGEFYPCKPDIFEATYEAVE